MPATSQEESKQAAVDPFVELTSVIKKEDYVKFMMKKYTELNHLPPLFYDSCKKLKDTFGSSQAASTSLSMKLSSILQVDKFK